MPDSTRMAILELLAELRTAGVKELSQRLAISPAGVRYHLAKLSSEGLIEYYSPAADQIENSRGRPARHYRLPLHRQQDNLARLCTAFVYHHISNRPGQWDVIAEKLVHPPPDRLAFQRRLDSAVFDLNAMHYQAVWEAGPRGPRIRLHNCPYAAIWGETPELCQLDEEILSRLTAGKALQVARTSFGTDQPASCLFEIQEKRP
jgi:predicted ArsR family transcriptional regulator